jgi:voltage-gated potassium channel
VFRFLRFIKDPHFFFGNVTYYGLKVLRLVFTVFIIFFISAGLFFYVEHTVNPSLSNFGDAFYFTVVTLTTVGFGDITPMSQGGKMVTVLMILSGIILIPWQAGQIIREWVHVRKKHRPCPKCGLQYHDPDATHCKHCGHVVFQESEG